MQYKTILLWSTDKKELLHFYKYNMNIRYIPAGISFKYRNKEYSTVNIMNMIVTMCNLKIKQSWNFTPEYWYNMRNGVFYKDVFIKFHDSLTKQFKN